MMEDGRVQAWVVCKLRRAARQQFPISSSVVTIFGTDFAGPLVASDLRSDNAGVRLEGSLGGALGGEKLSRT